LQEHIAAQAVRGEADDGLEPATFGLGSRADESEAGRRPATFACKRRHSGQVSRGGVAFRSGGRLERLGVDWVWLPYWATRVGTTTDTNYERRIESMNDEGSATRASPRSSGIPTAAVSLHDKGDPAPPLLGGSTPLASRCPRTHRMPVHRVCGTSGFNASADGYPRGSEEAA
jgi:hypothetical protein